MIHLVPVVQSKVIEQTLKDIYLDSFPEDERRDWNELLELIPYPSFNLYSINHNNDTVGLLTFWKWPEFLFIEHFAIDKSMRGKGIGSEVLSQLKKETFVKIILETEEPHTESAKRRIVFYNSSGFQLCFEDYYQPAYSPGKKAVKMLLMGYPDNITPAEFPIIKAKLYKEVYHRNVKGFL